MRPYRLSRLLAGIIVMLPLLAGCGQQSDIPGAPSPAQANDLFKTGDAIMVCTLSCAFQYGAHRRVLQSDYESQNWQDLAANLLAIGHDSDQSWFYLAAAAQGLGYRQAAQRYYFNALSAPLRCRGTCDGLRFPDITFTRLAALDSDVANSPNFAQLGETPPPPGGAAQIHLFPTHGLLAAPGEIDGDLPLMFTVDSGSDVITLPFGAAIVLIHDHKIEKSDILGGTNAMLANGAVVRAISFKIHTLRVGNVTVKNVTGAITERGSQFLLGQSFLNQFQSWSIDNQGQILSLRVSGH